MKKSELNRDIKRLKKAFDKRKTGDTRAWRAQEWNEYQEEQDKLTEEFLRLYRLDKNFDNCSLISLKTMLIINTSLRAVPFHNFGSIEIN